MSLNDSQPSVLCCQWIVCDDSNYSISLYGSMTTGSDSVVRL